MVERNNQSDRGGRKPLPGCDDEGSQYTDGDSCSPTPMS